MAETGNLQFQAGITTAGLFADATKVEQRIQAMSGKIAGAGKEASESFRKEFSFLSPEMLGFGAIGLAFGKIITDSKEFAKQFKASMLEIQTISPAVAADFNGISQAVLGISTKGIKDDAIGLNKALYEIVSAGYDGAAGLKILEASAKGATGGVTETLTVADGLTSVMNAWGASVDQVNDISDQMFTTVRLGKTTMAELSSNIAKVAPLASAMGIGMDQVFAAIASITKQGTPTSEALTQMRAAMTAMNGVLGDGWSNSMTFQEGLGKIREMSGGSNTALKALLGTDEAVLATLALTGEKAQMAASDLGELRNSTGAAEAAFITMGQSSEVIGQTFKNNLDKAFSGFGSGISEAIDDVMASLNEAFANGTIDEFFNDAAKAIKAAAAMLVIYNASTIASTVSMIAQEGALKVLVMREEVLNRWHKISTATTLAYNTASTATGGVLAVVSTAMKTLWATMAANPLTAIIAVIGIAVGAFMAFHKGVKSASDAQEEFNRLQEQSGNLDSTDKMIARYDELSKKTNLNNAEQQEQARLLDVLSQKYPDAITKIDEHGKVLAMNTEKMKGYNEEQRKTLQIIAQQQLEDVNKAIEKNKKKLTSLGEDITSGDGSRKDMEKYQKALAEIESLNKTKAGLEEQLGIKVELPVSAEVVTSPKDQKKTEEQAKATVGHQIEAIKKQISEAKKKLGEMRSLGSVATDQDIEGQDKLISDLEKKLETLTGIKNKEKKDDIISEQDRLKAREELAKQQIEIQQKLEEGRISAMQEGKQKRLAEAEDSYQQELQQIKDQEASFLEQYNLSKGIKKGAKNYITSIPVDAQAGFDAMRVQAEEKKNASIRKINEDAQKEIRAIWKESNGAFLTDQQKEIDSVNEKYDELVKRAEESGASIDAVNNLNANRQKELNEIGVKNTIETLDKEEQAALDHAESSIRNENKLNIQKLKIQKDFMLKRIEALKKSNAPESKQEIQNIESDIDKIDKEIGKTKTDKLVQGLGDASTIMGSMAGVAGLVSEELGSQVDAMANIAGNAANFASNLASGNWVGAVTSGFELITSIAEQFSNIDEKFVSAQVKAEALKEIMDSIHSLTTSVVSSPGAFANYLETQKRLVEDLRNEYKQLGGEVQTKASSGDAILNLENNIRMLEDEIARGADAITAERYKQEIAQIEKDIEYLRENPYEAQYSDKIQYYLDQIESARKYIEEGQLTQEELDKATQRIEDYQQNVQDVIDSYADYIAALEETIGFSSDDLTSSIVDGITQGLQLADDGLGDFADSFQSLLQNAATKAMTATFQSKYMEQLMVNFSNALSDGVLADQERIELEKQYKDAVEGMKVYFANWENLFGDMGEETEKASGISGEAKQITDKTATAIEGNLNALLYNSIEVNTGVKEMRALAVQQLESLRMIAANTSHNYRLIAMDENIAKLKSSQALMVDSLASIDRKIEGGQYGV